MKVWTRGPKKVIEECCETVRSKDGEDLYERDGFRVMVTAVDWYLTEKEYKRPIIRDRELESLKQVLEGKACLFQQQSKGRRPSQWVKARNKNN